jgi:putative tricarboxylic transport membrane protein
MKYPGVFFLLLSIYVGGVSFLRLDLGSLHKPGPGFMPFWSAIILGILTIIMLLQDSLPHKEKEAEEKREKIHWQAVFLAFASLLICIFIFERLGYILSTLLFVGFLLKYIEKKRWLSAILASVLMTLFSYCVFKVWLQADLPKGIFGF